MIVHSVKCPADGHLAFVRFDTVACDGGTAWKRSGGVQLFSSASQQPGIFLAPLCAEEKSMRTLARFASLILVTGLVIAPAAEAQRRRIYVRIAPPAPVVERVVVSPHRGYIWQPGYYVWAGNRYVLDERGVGETAILPRTLDVGALDQDAARLVLAARSLDPRPPSIVFAAE